MKSPRIGSRPHVWAPQGAATLSSGIAAGPGRFTGHKKMVPRAFKSTGGVRAQKNIFTSKQRHCLAALCPRRARSCVHHAKRGRSKKRSKAVLRRNHARTRTGYVVPNSSCHPTGGEGQFSLLAAALSPRRFFFQNILEFEWE